VKLFFFSSPPELCFAVGHGRGVWPFSQHPAMLTLCCRVWYKHRCGDLRVTATPMHVNQNIFLVRRKANNGVSSDLNAARCWLDLQCHLHSLFGFAQAHLHAQAQQDWVESIRKLPLQPRHPACLMCVLVGPKKPQV